MIFVSCVSFDANVNSIYNQLLLARMFKLCESNVVLTSSYIRSHGSCRRVYEICLQCTWWPRNVYQRIIAKKVFLHEFVSRWNMLATFKRTHLSSLKHAFCVDQLGLKHLNAYISKVKSKIHITMQKVNAKYSVISYSMHHPKPYVYGAYVMHRLMLAPLQEQLFNSNFNFRKKI